MTQHLDEKRSCVADASCVSLLQALSQGTTLTGVPFAGAFTWLNRHDDSSAGGQDVFRQGGTGTQGTRQRSGKSEQPKAQRQARQGIEPQPLQSQAEQERLDGRAFKSTDSRWKPDRAHWKFPRPAASSSYMPQRVSEASAGTSETSSRVRGATGRASTFRFAAQSFLASNAQQYVLPDPTESSQKQALHLRSCFCIRTMPSQHLAHTNSVACQKSAAQHFAVCGT